MKAVFGALGIAFGIGSDWDNCCSALHVDANLIEKIKGYDKDRMSDALIDELSQYINTPLMEPQNVARNSAALVGLAKWVRALVQYGKQHLGRGGPARVEMSPVRPSTATSASRASSAVK